MSHAVKLKQERMVWLGLGLTGSVLMLMEYTYTQPGPQLGFEQNAERGNEEKKKKMPGMACGAVAAC